jgi:hypothetical protein
MVVDVVLNVQQLELIERLCAELGLASPAEALRLGLREHHAAQGGSR